MRAALEDLVSSVGLQVRLFASPQEFLQSNPPDILGCLVLDVRLPGMSGLTFQNELARAGIAFPVIFITGHGDIPMSVRAMKAGAVEFLTKPFHEQDLLDAICAGIERDRVRRPGGIDRRRAAGAVRCADGARAPDHGARRHWTGEQADRGRAQPQRDDCEGSPWAGDAEDESGVTAGPRADGRPGHRAEYIVVGDHYQRRAHYRPV
jgi:DNA-binding response OmpR family regulator